jgi:hypothetical protein
MDEILKRVWENLMARVTGPINFRLIIQPLVASFLAVRAGFKDAREGQPPFLWTIISDPSRRSELLRHGWKDVGKVFLLAMLLDAIYQLIFQRGVYVLELLVVATTLAVVPYLLIRGPVTRLMRRAGRSDKGAGENQSI